MSRKRHSSARSKSRSVESTEPVIWCISRERRGPAFIRRHRRCITLGCHRRFVKAFCVGVPRRTVLYVAEHAWHSEVIPTPERNRDAKYQPSRSVSVAGHNRSVFYVTPAVLKAVTRQDPAITIGVAGPTPTGDQFALRT